MNVDFAMDTIFLWKTLKPTETGENSKTITIWVQLQSNDNIFLGVEYVFGV